MRKIKFKKYFPKIAISILLLLFIFEPAGLALAQSSLTAAQQKQIQDFINQVEAQNRAQNSGTAPTFDPAGTAGLAAGAATCSVGNLLANILSSSVGKAIDAIKGEVTDAVTDAVTNTVAGGKEVPVNDKKTRDNTMTETINSKRLVDARVGGGKTTAPITTTFMDGLGSVSWDSVAFCIGNEMIKYIGQSTIRWIQSGFKGNPVFVDNPDGFFKNIADQEAGQFIQQLVGQTTGINVCQPFRVALALDTVNSYSGIGRGPLTCSLSTIQNNYERFTGGDWESGGFPGWFELIEPQNNIYGARQIANKQLLDITSSRQNTALIELNWSKGYKNFKICTTGELPDGTCPPKPDGTSGENTTTLGGYVENAVNARGAAPGHRLEIATTFDQIISALINELIKVAVTDLFSQEETEN